MIFRHETEIVIKLVPGVGILKIGQNRFHDPAPQTRRFLSDFIIKDE